MNKNLYVLILLLCGLTFTSYAQKDTEVEIIFFDDEKKEQDNSYNKGLFLIKTNPLSSLWGKQFIEAETPLRNFLSLDVGLGATFAPVIASPTVDTDYYEIFDECTSDNWGNNGTSDYCDEYGDYSIRSSKIGFYGSAAIKLYFNNLAPENLYVSLNLKYSTASNDVLLAKDGANIVEFTSDHNMEETIKHLDYSLRLGYQSLFNPLISDIFLGVGLRNKNETRPDIGFDRHGLVQNAVLEIKENTIIWEAGIRIGFSFQAFKEKDKNASNKSKGRKKKSRR